MFVWQVRPSNPVSRATSKAARLWGSQEVFTLHTFTFSSFLHQVHIIALPLFLAGGFKPPPAPHWHLRPLTALPDWRGPLLQRRLVSIIPTRRNYPGKPPTQLSLLQREDFLAAVCQNSEIWDQSRQSHVSWLLSLALFSVRAELSIAGSPKGAIKLVWDAGLPDRYR